MLQELFKKVTDSFLESKDVEKKQKQSHKDLVSKFKVKAKRDIIISAYILDEEGNDFKKVYMKYNKRKKNFSIINTRSKRKYIKKKK